MHLTGDKIFRIASTFVDHRASAFHAFTTARGSTSGPPEIPAADDLISWSGLLARNWPSGLPLNVHSLAVGPAADCSRDCATAMRLARHRPPAEDIRAPSGGGAGRPR